MDLLAESSGYRTSHLPSDAELARRMWDEVYRQASPPWAPRTGQEVVAEAHRRYESAALAKEAENTVSRIEDHRGRPGPVRIPMR
jgi:hypothetical protein